MTQPRIRFYTGDDKHWRRVQVSEYVSTFRVLVQEARVLCDDKATYLLASRWHKIVITEIALNSLRTFIFQHGP